MRLSHWKQLRYWVSNLQVRRGTNKILTKQQKDTEILHETNCKCVEVHIQIYLWWPPKGATGGVVFNERSRDRKRDTSFEQLDRCCVTSPGRRPHMRHTCSQTAGSLTSTDGPWPFCCFKTDCERRAVWSRFACNSSSCMRLPCRDWVIWVRYWFCHACNSYRNDTVNFIIKTTLLQL